MDGIALTKIVDAVLKERGISRLELCNAIGITSSAYSNWKSGGQPRKDKIEAIENYLGISLHDADTDLDPEIAELLESIRARQDLRVLLHSARGVPPSSVYALVSQLEKIKEEST